MHDRKILIACYEVPGWGGASTATYSLFEWLQSDTIDVSLINIVGEHDAAYFSHRFGEEIGNPRKLPRVHNCILSGNNYQYHPQLHRLITEINPDVVVGVGWIAAYVLHAADPNRKLVYITTGCGWMGIYAEQKPGNDLQTVTQHQLNNAKSVTAEDALEESAIEVADLVVAHSDINRHLYTTLYAGHAGKVYNKVVWFSEWIFREAERYQALAKPFAKREIDVLFVANDWSRMVKGYCRMEKIIKRLRGANTHIVGEIPQPLRAAVQHNFITDRETLFRLMGNARAVVSPSSYDAAPGILFEAAAMGCNVVASKNCGNWELCHPELLAKPPSPAAFVRCIELALTRAFPSNIARYNGQGSFLELKSLLAVV